MEKKIYSVQCTLIWFCRNEALTIQQRHVSLFSTHQYLECILKVLVITVCIFCLVGSINQMQLAAASPGSFFLHSSLVNICAFQLLKPQGPHFSLVIKCSPQTEPWSFIPIHPFCQPLILFRIKWSWILSQHTFTFGQICSSNLISLKSCHPGHGNFMNKNIWLWTVQ